MLLRPRVDLVSTHVHGASTISESLEYIIIPDVIYLDTEGQPVPLRRNPSPGSAAARLFLSSPKFDRCKFSVFAVMDGCGRELSSDEVTIAIGEDEPEQS